MTAVFVGIDAGGSSTRAVAVRDGQVVFEGLGGPGNPGTVLGPELRDSYATALRECPTPNRIAACVAGAGSKARRNEIRDLLHDLAPDAEVEVFPDYWAALEASPDADVCVVAGTGSVVCSRDSGGEVHVSGGRGWILGDPGSASWLGRAVLARYVEDPDGFDGESTVHLRAIYGTGSWVQIVQKVHRAAVPPATLALAAPVLTRLASRGVEWARIELDEAMTALARTTVCHVDRFVQSTTPQVALFGGVWNAPVAVESFRKTVDAQTHAWSVLPSRDDPLEGAVRLAANGD